MESKPLTEWKGRNSPIHDMLMISILKFDGIPDIRY